MVTRLRRVISCSPVTNSNNLVILGTTVGSWAKRSSIKIRNVCEYALNVMAPVR